MQAADANMMPTDLSDLARDIVIKRPMGWEYLLLARVLQDEIQRADTTSGSLRPQPVDDSLLTLDRIPDWAMERIDEISTLLERIDILNQVDESVFGPPGSPGDPEKIIRLSKGLGGVYARVRAWSMMISTTQVDPSAKNLLKSLASLADPVIESLRAFGPHVEGRIERLAAGERPDGGVVNLVLEVGSPNIQAVLDAVKALTEERSGYVYVLVNSSLPGVVKIGRTSRSPAERAQELSAATGVPTSFVVAYEERFSDCVEAEIYVHDQLAALGHRVSANREFFRICAAEAVQAVIAAKRALEGA